MFIFQQNMSFSASQAAVLLHLTRLKYSLNAALDPRASVKNRGFFSQFVYNLCRLSKGLKGL